MKITKDKCASRDTYSVESPSGNTYTVRYMGSGDADPEYVSIWECDCPAAKCHPDRVCKHIGAVIDATTDEWGDPCELGAECAVA